MTITPGFAGNQQTVQICPGDDPTGATPACVRQQQAANFVYLRTAPGDTAPLFGDQAIHKGAAGTDRISDWGSTAQAGQQFVVAGIDGDWTAIWFSGTKVWFHNPDGANTTPAHGVTLVSAAGTTPVAVYGSSYPDPAEYPAGLSPSTQTALSYYTVPAGQAYVATRPPVNTDDYFSSGAVVIGAKQDVHHPVQPPCRTGLLLGRDRERSLTSARTQPLSGRPPRTRRAPRLVPSQRLGAGHQGAQVGQGVAGVAVCASLDEYVAQGGRLGGTGDDRESAGVGGEPAQQLVARAAADDADDVHRASGQALGVRDRPGGGPGRGSPGHSGRSPPGSRARAVRCAGRPPRYGPASGRGPGTPGRPRPRPTGAVPLPPPRRGGGRGPAHPMRAGTPGGATGP